MKSSIGLLLLLDSFLACAGSAAEPLSIPLWPNGVPGFEDKKDIPERAESYWVRNVHNPSITAFLPPPDKATCAAGAMISIAASHRNKSTGRQG